MTTPAETLAYRVADPARVVAALAQAIHDETSPMLGSYNLCRTGSLIVMSVCRARAIEAEMRYSPHHPLAANGPHFFVTIGDSEIHLLSDRKFHVKRDGSR